MLIKLDAPKELNAGINHLINEGFNIGFSDSGYPVKAVKNITCHGFKIDAKKDGAVIEYDTKARFFYALSNLAENFKTEFTMEKISKAENIGLMRDCARNAVTSVKGAKKLIMALALSGYNYFELYVEDVMKIDKYPYLGYKRGGYTGDEIKTLVEFGESVGVELVPCVQTLAHMGAIFRYDVFEPIHDRDDILLCGEEKTYEFIDSIIDFCEKNFKSHRINIGMDEAHAMLLGQYLQKNGYAENRAEVFMKHLNRVLDICRKHNFKPHMWSDMIFKVALGTYKLEAYSDTKGKKFDEEFIKNFPKDLTIIYWDYYSKKRSIYDKNFDMHYKITDNVMFAGGVWTWIGFAPNNSCAERTTDLAVKSGLSHGCKDFIFTAWGDLGGETPIFAVLSSIMYAAERLYGDEGSLKERLNKRLSALCGNSYDDFKSTELLNKPFKTTKSKFNGRAKDEVVNPAKYALYNDPLLGIADAHIVDEMSGMYKTIARKMKRSADKCGMFSYMFNMYYLLADALSVKATLGKDIKKAYDDKDDDALYEIASKRIPLAIKKIKAFYDAHRITWLKEYKSIGFEVSGIRIGATIQRLEEAEITLLEYLGGKIEKIEELEEPRLPMASTLKEGDAICYQSFQSLVSASTI